MSLSSFIHIQWVPSFERNRTLRNSGFNFSLYSIKVVRNSGSLKLGMFTDKKTS
jgi:hypothetical protein